MKTYKCGINPESNVHLVYRGGCEKPLTIEDAYRCTGCNQRFHKDCILEHFKQEKDHDWGRAVERAEVIAEVEGIVAKVQRKITSKTFEDPNLCLDVMVDIDDSLAELRAKLVEMKEGK